MQRGNNRPADLRRPHRPRPAGTAGRRRHTVDVTVHSYVLMSDHLHLLAAPIDGRRDSAAVQSIRRSCVRYFVAGWPHRHPVRGPPPSRTLVQTDRYLLACMVYSTWTRFTPAWSRSRATLAGPATRTARAATRQAAHAAAPMYSCIRRHAFERSRPPPFVRASVRGGVEATWTRSHALVARTTATAARRVTSRSNRAASSRPRQASRKPAPKREAKSA